MPAQRVCEAAAVKWGKPGFSCPMQAVQRQAGGRYLLAV
jgi:hypothetical protein